MKCKVLEEFVHVCEIFVGILVHEIVAHCDYDVVGFEVLSLTANEVGVVVYLNVGILKEVGKNAKKIRSTFSS